MAQNKNAKASKRTSTSELDSIYVLKIVLYLILGAQWLWLTPAGSSHNLPIPLGLLIGIIFALHDHFQIDRKIEYAMLLLAALVGFVANIGLYIGI